MSDVKIFIVDDEEQGRNALRTVVQKYTSFQVCGEAKSKKEAIELICDVQPDIVLLDINLGDGNGFEVLKELESLPKVIFVTAYDEYALRAFQFNAVDYVLKPFDPLQVVESLTRASKQLKFETGKEPEKQLVSLQSNTFDKIVLPTQNGFDVLELSEVIAIQSDNNYSIFFLTNGDQKVVSKTLKYYDELLKDHHFFRCHQQNLINLQHIKNYLSGEGGEIRMKNDLVFQVSRRKKEELLTKIKSVFKK